MRFEMRETGAASLGVSPWLPMGLSPQRALRWLAGWLAGCSTESTRSSRVRAASVVSLGERGGFHSRSVSFGPRRKVVRIRGTRSCVRRRCAAMGGSGGSEICWRCILFVLPRDSWPCPHITPSGETVQSCRRARQHSYFADGNTQVTRMVPWVPPVPSASFYHGRPHRPCKLVSLSVSQAP